MRFDSRRWHGLILAVLVLLAGCSGVLPAEDGASERDPFGVDDELASSGVEDETPEPDPDPDTLAPGLTDDGVRNKLTLLDHHFAALESERDDGAYVATSRSNATVDGALLHDSRTRVVTQYPDRWNESTVETSYGDDGAERTTRERWAEASTLVTKSTSSNGSTEYRYLSVDGQPGHPPWIEDTLYDRLSAMSILHSNVSVDERVRNETAWYVVTRTSQYRDGSVETHTLHVREDGLVQRSYHETVTERSTGHAVRRSSLVYEFSPEATLERPDWYDDALEATAAG